MNSFQRRVSGVAALLALFGVYPSGRAQRMASAGGHSLWRSVNTQGMGFVTGIVAHPVSGDIYLRTDVGGAYRFDRAFRRWIPLLDAFGTENARTQNVESIAVDPQNFRNFYAVVQASRSDTPMAGESLFSANRGETWTTTGLSALRIFTDPNGNWRGWCGERLVCDPNKSGLLYYASGRDGLLKKVGTQPWTSVSGGLPPASSLPGYYSGPDESLKGNDPGYTFAAFDSSSSRPGTATRTLYVGVYGLGVYGSTDGGVTWRNLGGAANPVRGTVASNGTLFVSFGSNDPGQSGSVRSYRNGVWTDITPNGNHQSWQGISTDPAHPQTVLVTHGENKEIYRSTDGGSHWTRLNVSTSKEAAYYPAPTALNYFHTAGDWGSTTILIDPLNPNEAWQTNGYGVIHTQDVSASQTRWAWEMNNLEELVINDIKCPPLAGGADLLSVTADMIGQRHASRDTVPLANLGTFDYVAQGTSLAYCAAAPQNLAYVGWDQARGWWNLPSIKTGISADNGLTWTPFPTLPTAAEDSFDTTTQQWTSYQVIYSGGAVAMSSTHPQNLVWAPSHWGVPQRTTDGGLHWSLCRNAAAVRDPNNLDHNYQNDWWKLTGTWHLANEWWHTRVLEADRVDGNRFYYWAYGQFYFSTDSGLNWTPGQANWRMSPASDAWTLQTNIVPHPTHAGEVWLSFKPNEGTTSTFKLYRSMDSGVSFSAISSVDRCNYVAFGRGNSPDAPFIYLHGRVNGAAFDGVYVSKDSGLTWTLLTDPRLSQFGTITCLEADLRYRGRVYVGTGGRGIFVTDGEIPVSNLIPPPLTVGD